jgi:hypothetical protein
MKSEQKLTSRYADLLAEPSDDALDKLVQELDTAYTAPERPAGLSWATASQLLVLVSQQTLNAETRPRVWPLRLHAKHGGQKALLAFAAIIVVTLLSVALLSTIGASWFRQSHQAQPFPGTSPSLAAGDALLLQQLFQSTQTPTSIKQLAQYGQFTKVNLTVGSGNVTIQKVYADANNVVLTYTADLSAWKKAVSCSLPAVLSNQCRSEPLVTVATSAHQALPFNQELVNFGKEPVSQNQRVAVLAYYDASSIQGNPKQLRLRVSLSEKVSQSQKESVEFTGPFHADKTVINVNQTVISHGDALTLERVVMTPTETRFYNRTSPSPAVFPMKLSIAGKSYDANPFPADLEHPNMYGWFGYPSDNYVSFHESLQGQTGTWTLTEYARVGTNGDTWTFTFTVS